MNCRHPYGTLFICHLAYWWSAVLFMQINIYANKYLGAALVPGVSQAGMAAGQCPGTRAGRALCTHWHCTALPTPHSSSLPPRPPARTWLSGSIWISYFPVLWSLETQTHTAVGICILLSRSFSQDGRRKAETNPSALQDGACYSISIFLN